MLVVQLVTLVVVHRKQLIGFASRSHLEYDELLFVVGGCWSPLALAWAHPASLDIFLPASPFSMLDSLEVGVALRMSSISVVVGDLPASSNGFG